MPASRLSPVRALVGLFLCFASVSRASAPLILSDAERAWVTRHGVIRVQMSEHYPPFEMREGRRGKGLSFDFLKAAADSLGLTLEVSELAWSAALPAIQRPNPPVDLLMDVTESPERARQMRLTRPFLSFPQVICTTKQHTFIGGLRDLDGARVAVEKDYLTQGLLQRALPRAILHLAVDTGQALRAVAEGKVDAYVGNLGAASYYMTQGGLTNLKVAAPTGFPDDALCMGVRRDWPELVALLDRAFAAIPPQESAELRSRWLAVRYEYGLGPWDILKWMLLVGGIALLFIGQLKLQVRLKTRELEASHARLAGAERRAALGALAAGVAHDFNNLLAAVKLGIGSVLESEKDPERREDLESAAQAADRAGKLVRQLTEFGRVNHLHPHALDAFPLLDEVARLLRSSSPVGLQVELSGSGPAWVLADPDCLHRVLLNLGTNAQQALGSAGLIRFTLDGDRERVRITVSDNGPGMDEPTRTRAFEPYQSGRPHGTGLGLAVVKSLVESMDGSVQVRSSPGNGSEFEILLPRVSSPLEA